MTFSNAKVNLLLVVSPNCKFCNDSSEFYRRILAAGNANHAQVMRTFVLGATGVQDGQRYVASHALAVDEVRAVPSAAWSRLHGTPTVVVVDSTGLVLGSWSGQLPRAEQERVLSVIGHALTVGSGL